MVVVVVVVILLDGDECLLVRRAIPGIDSELLYPIIQLFYVGHSRLSPFYMRARGFQGP